MVDSGDRIPEKAVATDGGGTMALSDLADAEGVVRRAWRKVNVKGHVDEVFEAARDL